MSKQISSEEEKAAIRDRKRLWAQQARKDPIKAAKIRQQGLESHNRNKEKRLALAREWKSLNQEKLKEYRSLYYQENQEKEREQHRNFHSANPDKKAIYSKDYLETHAEKIAAKRKLPEYRQWRQNHQRHRYATDPKYRLGILMRGLLYQALKLQGTAKTHSIDQLLGCTLAEAKAHIASQFTKGMSWENHGKWHVDHKRPCASFDLRDQTQQGECFHFTNLQPLWADENRKKNSYYDGIIHRYHEPPNAE